jgi:hypothetical protein
MSAFTLNAKKKSVIKIAIRQLTDTKKAPKVEPDFWFRQLSDWSFSVS